jgi:hypothetical protein
MRTRKLHLSEVADILEESWKRILCKPVNMKRKLEESLMQQPGAILKVAVAMSKRFVLLSQLSNTSGCGPVFWFQCLLLI